MKDKISNANFPKDGCTTSQSKRVANRVITVGDPARLHRFKRFLDAEPKPFELSSARGYTTVTGRYRGVPVTLIAIGMGVAMVDFFVREVRAVVEGDLAIIRFGSCGSLTSSLPVGSIGVPEQAMTISTNYAHWHGDAAAQEPPYLFSPAIPADPGLHDSLLSTLENAVASPSCKVHAPKLHASADCFYSSQGRIDRNFADDNDTLIDDLVAKNPDCSSLEMETAHLFHLASISRPSATPSRIRAAACHMVFAGRRGDGTGDFIDPDVVADLEPKVGRACLDAIIGWNVEREHPPAGTVWAK
ncbi:hypothetical protein Rhopal_005601-T1 [Rhodotorula paludigena]|uniref:Nucleoside phosphorylase domain-containing protein n=1 Tax=Rhodotorula paludigena TaxID=86838 RepID=A0AAV5GJD5_9BASI|nr:hypothetical protein Rhopal_005601-T1 [Rhodotorula paludigena]